MKLTEKTSPTTTYFFLTLCLAWAILAAPGAQAASLPVPHVWLNLNPTGVWMQNPIDSGDDNSGLLLDSFSSNYANGTFSGEARINGSVNLASAPAYVASPPARSYNYGAILAGVVNNYTIFNAADPTDHSQVKLTVELPYTAYLYGVGSPPYSSIASNSLFSIHTRSYNTLWTHNPVAKESNQGNMFTGNHTQVYDITLGESFNLWYEYKLDVRGYTPAASGQLQTGPFSFSVTKNDERLDVNVVPLPGAAWLLGSGLAGLIGMRRKKA